jgi:hypothetical protein
MTTSRLEEERRQNIIEWRAWFDRFTQDELHALALREAFRWRGRPAVSCSEVWNAGSNDVLAHGAFHVPLTDD